MAPRSGLDPCRERCLSSFFSKLLEAFIKYLEKAAKVLRLGLRDDVRDLFVHFTSFLYATEVRLEELFEARVRSSSLLD